MKMKKDKRKRKDKTRGVGCSNLRAIQALALWRMQEIQFYPGVGTVEDAANSAIVELALWRYKCSH